MIRSFFTAPLAANFRCLRFSVIHSIWLITLTLGVVAATTLPALAQTKPSQTATRDFDIPAGALGSALLRFGQQSGLQFSVGSELTRGKRTSGIKGKYTPEDGLRALLAGSGLMFRFTGPRTVVVEPLPDTGEARVLDPLRIEGADSSSTVSGVNGSTDPTATENSGTYAATATATVSKTAQSVLDTPQTVSVMTRQQMSDQNINDYWSAMGQLPGITLRPSEDNQSFDVISRGFYIDKIRIDGGGPITTQWFLRPSFDMAMYDHVEVLRGADGMYSGYGNPGGVVNLVRKRPLDHNQILMEAQVGSWNNYRTMIDVTGPLGFDGRLRGRAVATYQDKDFFYDTAYDRHTMVYGILEADVTTDLVLRGGFSLTSQSALPWVRGLPRYETGADLGLSRETCLCYADADYEMTNKEVFLQAEYQFSPDWDLEVNLTRFKQRVYTWAYYPAGGVKPDTGRGFGRVSSYWNGYDRNPVGNSADIVLSGAFDLFDREQKITFGANYMDAYHNARDYQAYTFGSMAYLGRIDGIEAGNPKYLGVDVLHFDPNDPNYRPYVKRLDAFYDEGNKEYTIYANWNAKLTDRLQLNLGFRYSYFSTYTRSQSFCRPFVGDTCEVLGPNENGEWVPVSTIGIGEPNAPLSKKVLRNVDRSFSWPPSWSLVYNINDNWSIYGSYTDIYTSIASQVDPNYDPLPPETGFNAELGSNFLSDDGKLNGKLSMYYIKKDGFAVWLYDDIEYNQSHSESSSCCYLGGDDTQLTSYGLDVEVAGEILSGWQASAGYSFNINTYEFNTIEFQTRSPLLSFAPKHMLKLWTTYQFNNGPAWLRRVNVGGGVNMQTKTYDTGSICTDYVYGDPDPFTGLPTSTCANTTDYDFTQGFYSIYSARAGYRINDNWNVALNINNLFDKKYYAKTAPPTYGNWYGEPRNFALTLRGQF